MIVGLAFVGALIGWALFQEIAGLVMGGMWGWLTAWVVQLRGEVQRLRERAAPRAPTRQASSATAAEPHEAPAAPRAPAKSEIPSAAREAGTRSVQDEPPAPPWPLPAMLKALAWAKDYVMTGNVVLRVGLVILFFGVSFLVKYTADHALLPIELRLAAVALGGIAMLVFGFRLRRSRWLYGVLLQGGGVGVLYLTIFAALSIFGLIPPLLGFALLIALVVLSAVLAIRQDARGLACFGAVGGFLAPVLASTGEGSHVTLFSYYALLNAGILGIAYFRAWRELNLIGFGFTFVLGAAWGYRLYRPELYATTQPFLVLFFLFFVAIPVLFARRQAPRLKGYVDGTLVFGVPLAAFGLQAGLLHGQPLLLGYSALAVAALYVGLATGFWRRADMRQLAEAFLALGIAFVTLAVPLALDSHWTTVAWALQGLGLIWVGCRQQRLLPRLSGTVLQFAAGISFVMTLLAWPNWAALPVLNGFYLGCLVLSLSALTGAWLLRSQPLRRWERFYSPALLVWGLIWWYGGGLAEVVRQVESASVWTGVALFLSASAVALALAARRLSWSAVGYPAMALWPIMLGVALITWVNYPQRHLLTAEDWPAWTGFFAAHLVLLRAAPWPDLWRRVSHAASLWFVVLLAVAELGWLAAFVGASSFPNAWTVAAWGAVAGAAMVAVSVRGFPSSFAAAYRSLGVTPVAVFGGLWVLLASTHPGTPEPLPYWPLLNPLDLAQMFLLMALTFWWRRWGSTGAATQVRGFVAAGIALAAFVWVNTVLARAVHHWGDVAYEFSALFESVVWQAALAVSWGLGALVLMRIAYQRLDRAVWIAGAALLALVVVKLFAIDLSGSGSVARIVSFLGVGLLMLVIGFLAPLPPRDEAVKA